MLYIKENIKVLLSIIYLSFKYIFELLPRQQLEYIKKNCYIRKKSKRSVLVLMKYLLTFFISLSITSCFGQLSQLLKADLFTPALTYEQPFLSSYSVSATFSYRPDIIIGKSHSHFYLHPSTSLIARRYFYVHENIEAGRPPRNNNGNYFFLGSELVMSKGIIPIYQSSKIASDYKPQLIVPFGLGFQRNISNSFYMNILVGLQYFPLHTMITPHINIQLGSVLYEKKMKNNFRITRNRKIKEKRKDDLENIYATVEVNNTSGFLRNNFIDSYIVNRSLDKSNSLDFSLSVGYRLKNKTYGLLSVGRTTIQHFYEFNPEGPRHGDIEVKHPQFNMSLGIEQYLPLKLKNAHLILSPRITTVFENYGDHYAMDEVLRAEFRSPLKAMVGMDLMSRFEYKIYKRLSAYAHLGYSHILNGKNLYKFSLYYYDTPTEPRIDVFTQEVRPFYFYYGLGVKVGLEHSSFYR